MFKQSRLQTINYQLMQSLKKQLRKISQIFSLVSLCSMIRKNRKSYGGYIKIQSREE